MSLYSALHAGVSGLGAQSSAMAAVADNISNMNTVGYKGVDTQFTSLVNDGDVRAPYTAGGVAAAPRALISRQGLIEASAGTTDLAIDGAGFFVARATSDPASQTIFTRAGSFRPDDEGFLRNSAGHFLQGWRLDSQGQYVNNGTVDQLEPIRISDLSGTASATTRIDVRANLQSSTPAFTGTYAPGDLASNTVTANFTRTVQVFDEQGAAHDVALSFVKTAANEWQAEIHAQPATEVTAPGGLLASGTVRFNGDGSLDVAGSSPSLFQPLTIGWTNGAGAKPVNLGLGSAPGLGGLTQFDASSSLISANANGGLLGNVGTVSVASDGEVSAIFEDGTRLPIFRLPMATFPNPDGLTRLPGNGYTVSDASGGFALNEPGALGAGRIQSSALEASTVDLASEFSNMIRFQRAYSAASKIITTVDDMLQEVSNLKR